jgi:hypothetical protein
VLVEQGIRALRAEGFSVREIARELGLSRMKVHRVLMASAAAAADEPPPVPVVSDDPILALLTEADMAWLGVSAADAAAGLDPLQRYRMLGLPAGSKAGDAARKLGDHGRAGDAFAVWLHAAVSTP